MDRLDAMRLFARIVDRQSFTQAAQDLSVPRATATQVIAQMERRLGVRLLQRTTRVVRPTLDGEAYYRRCLVILDDVEDAEGTFRGATPTGMLRIEVQGTLARHFLMPSLPAFLDAYPNIDLSMSESERWVDVIREGVDCVLRYGALPDSDLIVRPVIDLERVTCASPGYIAKYGQPETIEALATHRAVGLRSLTTGMLRPFEFIDGKVVRRSSVPTSFSVTGTESFLAGVRLGLGIAQLPRFHVAADLAQGTLVQILPEWPLPPGPVSILYPRNRQLSPRVRLFINWAAQQFASA
jgi:DNA-binding transcriptional LysR family regulator